jgi:hypothetical protein
MRISAAALPFPLQVCEDSLSRVAAMFWPGRASFNPPEERVWYVKERPCTLLTMKSWKQTGGGARTGLQAELGFLIEGTCS